MEQNDICPSRIQCSPWRAARTALLVGLALAALPDGNPLRAADAVKCRVEYHWNTGSEIVEIDPGQTLKINQGNMKYVQNLVNWPVVLSLTNVQFPTINLNNQGDRDPLAWDYAQNVTLVSLECTGYVSAAQLIEAFKQDATYEWSVQALTAVGNSDCSAPRTIVKSSPR